MVSIIKTTQIWGPLSKPLKFGVHNQNHSNLGSIIKTTQIWGPWSKPLKFVKSNFYQLIQG